MKIREDRKIILLSVVGGLMVWVLDAAIDSFFFSQGSFIGSLLSDMSAHERFFRTFMVLSLIVFALVIKQITRKRRQIEERYKNLVELSSDIIYVSDRDAKQIFMNNAAYRILGRTSEEVIGKPMIELIHPDDREKTLEKRNELVVMNTDAVNFENRYVTKTGRAIPVLHNVRVLRNDQGEFIGTQGIARDITDRKTAEDELKKAIQRIEEEKARSESVLAAIGDGVSIQDADYKVLYQNRVHKQMSGGIKTGEYCYAAYAHSDAVCPGCPVSKTFIDGKNHTLEKDIVRGTQLLTIEIMASPLRDSSGKIIAGIEAVRDITERKKARERLTLFSKAIEEAGDGVQIVDLNGFIVYSNKAVQEIYGFSPEELSGTHVNLMNADPDFAGNVILPMIKDTGRWCGELIVKHKNGRTFPVWLSTSLVRDAYSNPIAMIGIIRDITDRKRSEEIVNRHRGDLARLVEERTKELTAANEKLRKEMSERERMEDELLKAQKLESLGILAGGIAHDFNNLLASVLGNISLAMLDIDRAHEAFSRLIAAEKASLRAQDLTRQLLTFSRGGVPVKKTTEITELIREAVSFALRGSNVRFELVIEDRLKLVDVDEGQFSQVIHNLVINANHAMPQGGVVTIRCSTIHHRAHGALPLREGEYVRISIEDHGIGISQEHLSRVFDPYFTTKQKGSGLGLATTYSIIKKHGGHISVESIEGVGSTFHVYLPVSRETKLPIRSSEGVLRKGTGSVLVMDDEHEVRETTGQVLSKLGYMVTLAEDGDEAIERYCSAREAGKPFALVIMDLTVPGGMGGTDALKKLREIDPDVKAIVSSGYSNDPVMADFRQHGFMGVVTKPYRIKELSEEVHKVINSVSQGAGSS